MSGELKILKEALLAESSLPDVLFTGTSYKQLMELRKKKWVVDDMYFADMESKSWDYAENKAVEDNSDNILIVIDTDKLNKSKIRVDRGSNEEEWELDMGQYIYSGNIQKAIINIYTDPNKPLKDKIW